MPWWVNKNIWMKNLVPICYPFYDFGPLYEIYVSATVYQSKKKLTFCQQEHAHYLFLINSKHNSLNNE